MKRLVPFLMSAVMMSGCGSSNSSSSSKTPPTVSYTIGGAVVNLVGKGLQLQDNGGDTLKVSGNGTFSFATQLPSESTYSVTVSTQPSGPVQTCGVTAGTGTATTNVTNVTVDCGHNEWTWVGGSNVAKQAGLYGAQGTAASGNVPGARSNSILWTDTSGNLWLFGGGGYDSTGATGLLNDLWKYSGSEWTWMGGSNLVYEKGTYGIQGITAPGNVPGARDGAGTWTDSSGKFWLFGGYGVDSGGIAWTLNDLWKYNGSEWTWMSGSNTNSQLGTYGTRGTAAPGNVPGARYGAVAWTDSSGNFWLLGGSGYDSTGLSGVLNDLWKFNGSEWTWMGGSDVADSAGIYGTLGTAAPANVPGARNGAVAWTDSSGNFWIFGGSGYDSAGLSGVLNDLWKFDGSDWTWVSGSNLANQTGVYGTQGIAAPANVPAARNGAVAWTDSSGNFWLFGGSLDPLDASGLLNDLWKYSSGEWTWVGGSNAPNQTGTHGTQGTAAPGNVPSAREGAVAWTDSFGNFWLFGGIVPGSPKLVDANDLWRYEP